MKFVYMKKVLGPTTQLLSGLPSLPRLRPRAWEEPCPAFGVKVMVNLCVKKK